MPTYVFCTGFEWGVNPVTSGGGIADLLTGAPTTVTSPVRSGSYALQCAPAGASLQYGKNITAANRIVIRVYLNLPSLPVADSVLFTISVTAGNIMRFRYINASNKFRVDWGSVGLQVSTMTVSANQWYRIDVDALINAATRTADWAIDGIPQTRSDSTEAGSTATGIRLGTPLTDTYTCQYDDLALSTTAADYPIGDGAFIGFLPNRDGTHNPGTNTIEDNSGNDIGSVTAWNLVDDVPMSETNLFVVQSACNLGTYAEINFAATSHTSFGGISAVLSYGAASTAANKGTTIILRGDGADFSIYGTSNTSVDMSEATLFYKSVVIPPLESVWDQNGLSALRARVGYSADVSPTPHWQGLLLEVETRGQIPRDSKVINQNRQWPGYRM